MGQEGIRRSMVRARNIDLSKDYDTICAWWTAHGSFPPKPEHLAPIGVMVEIDRKPVCAGFLYNTDSKICVFEFVVSNPEASKKDRDECLRHLIDRIKGLAKELGYTLIYTSVNIEAYISKLKDAGFIEADKNQVHMFYEVKDE